jgi:ribose transport system permease protein
MVGTAEMAPHETADVSHRATLASVGIRLRAWQGRFPMLQVVAIVLIYTIGGLTLPGLFSVMSIRSILVLTALVGLASIGQTLVVLIGSFDLSVAGFIVAGALVVTQFPELFGAPLALDLVGLVVGTAVLGGLVGYISHRFSVEPLIISLGMGSVVIGIVQVTTNGSVAGNSPLWLTSFSSPAGHTFGLPVPPIVVLWVAVGLVMAFVLGSTVAGRKLYLTGANPRAAALSLVRTRRTWIAVFALSAVLSALVGVVIAGFAGSVDTTVGGPYLFDSLAAVIVGGTTFGGPGSYTRTMVGALLLTVLTTVLVGHGLSAAAEQILYGIVIFVSVAVYGRERRVRDRV